MSKITEQNRTMKEHITSLYTMLTFISGSGFLFVYFFLNKLLLGILVQPPTLIFLVWLQEYVTMAGFIHRNG